MPTVKIDKFGGIVPRTAPSLLADGMATVAHNCRLESGKLVPLREPSFVNSDEHTVYHENGLREIYDANSLYCWKHTLRDGTVRTDFLAFPGRVYFTHGNIADDARDRIFVTGETGVSFRMSNGEVVDNCPAAFLFDRERGEIVRHCIVKEPLDAPRASVDSIPEGAEIAYSYFFFSWYDEYGYESPASLPSRNKNAGENAYIDRPLTHDANGTVTFQPIHIPAGAVGVRIYKTVAGDETDNNQLIHEFGSGELRVVESPFTLRMNDVQAAETMPEIEAPPPDLVDMTFVPGNFYAGRARSMPHTVLFSDVDNPTNWPTAFRYDVRDNLVKLAVTSNSVFALTDGTPFVLSGTAPESMTVASLATPAACVSERSVIVHRNIVYFASNDGLMAIADGANAGSSCQNVTEAYLTPDQWQELNPKSCIIGVHRDALHMSFHRKDGTPVNMRFDLRDGATALTTHDEEARCAVVDHRSGKLYFVRREGV
jgi:hypothetical protein